MPGPKLTTEQRQELRDRVLGGESFAAIAEDIGVARGTVVHHAAQMGIGGEKEAGASGFEPVGLDRLFYYPPWVDRALCAETDPDAFFPEKGGSTREAIEICHRCPVQVECLDYALDNNDRFGIWGGVSERDRRKLQKGTPA